MLVLNHNDKRGYVAVSLLTATRQSEIIIINLHYREKLIREWESGRGRRGKHEWANERTNERMYERTNERTNERKKERKKVREYESRRRQVRMKGKSLERKECRDERTMLENVWERKKKTSAYACMRERNRCTKEIYKFEKKFSTLNNAMEILFIVDKHFY